MAKVAKLVMVSFMTRVIVEDTASEAEILDRATPQLINKILSDLGENVEDITDDTECPFDPETDR